jgi:hypothetical protein
MVVSVVVPSASSICLSKRATVPSLVLAILPLMVRIGSP